ncbi:hypothetical protein Patl1_27621 [Pistacia atlantica]|uniref:Uncharacterized protein n=1 Tax=Pistacia atlantica TaxID=434234 RepID=A0ACC1BGM3_9ROSI|nr:hypothetical protein Patl1_27621 [Pistacia atlantica]
MEALGLPLEDFSSNDQIDKMENDSTDKPGELLQNKQKISSESPADKTQEQPSVLLIFAGAKMWDREGNSLYLF